MLIDPLIGQKLGDYTIVSLLGKGGMARVYKGYDEALDRYAAVKVITGEFATTDEAEYTARFQREARAIARLHHPNIVSIYQFGQIEGMYYMAMVFLDGKDLRLTLKDTAATGERVPLPVIVKMAREICSALDYAHTQGVIHRDIKPSNIMMTSNGAVLTDFGLALTSMEGTLGDTFGSAHYIAPEQAVSSARAVPQSDLYSLGVVLYEALTGKVPFDDPSAMTVALKHLNEEPPPPSFYNPELPPEVEKVILMALHKDPRQRYATCRDLYLALERALQKADSEDTFEFAAPKKGSTDPTLSTASLEAYLKSLRDDSPKKTTTSSGPQVVGGDSPHYATQPPPKLDRTLYHEARTVVGEANYRAPLAAASAKQKKGNRLLWIAGLIPILLLMIGVAAVLFWLGQDDDNNADEPTQSAVVGGNPTEESTQLAGETPTLTVAPSQTASAESTEQATSTNTATATTLASNTPSPSRTSETSGGGGGASPTNAATATATGTATATATATPSLTATTAASPTATVQPSSTLTHTATSTHTPAAPPEIRLEYNENFFVLYNISDRVQNIGNLVFQGNVEGRFEALDWEAAIRASNGDIFNFRAEGCVQVSADQFTNGPSCRYYNAYIWRTDADSHFWRASSGNTTFTVVLRGQPIAECQISAGTCEFALP
jgi:serine/threonine protein kinase